MGLPVAERIDTMRQRAEEDRVQAAREAFREFHAQCFWYLRADLEITPAEVPMIAEGLRKNGGRAGFRLAAELCR